MIEKKIYIVLTATLLSLFMSCGGNSAPSSGGGVARPPAPLVLARYRNIHIEAIPFRENALTTRFGAIQMNETTALFSMATSNEIGGGEPITYFNTFLSSNEEDSISDGSYNFTDFTFQLDNPHLRQYLRIGVLGIDIEQGDNISFIAGDPWLSNAPIILDSIINFSLRVGVRGEPIESFEPIININTVLYDWRHVRVFIDTSFCRGHSACISWMNKELIVQEVNNLFRQAAIHVSLVQNPNLSNVLILPVSQEDWTFDPWEDFNVGANNVVRINTAAFGTPARQLAVAIALVYGLEQHNHTSWGADNLMLVGASDISRATLTREQWRVLNRSAPPR